MMIWLLLLVALMQFSIPPATGNTRAFPYGSLYLPYKDRLEAAVANTSGIVWQYSGKFLCNLEVHYCMTFYLYESWDEPLHKGKTAELGFLPARCDNTSNHNYFVIYGILDEEDKRMFNDRVAIMLEIYHNCTSNGHTVRQDMITAWRNRGDKTRKEITAGFLMKENNSSKLYDRVHAARYESPDYKKANVPFWSTGVPIDTALFVGRMEYNWYTGILEWLNTFLYF